MINQLAKTLLELGAKLQPMQRGTAPFVQVPPLPEPISFDGVIVALLASAVAVEMNKIEEAKRLVVIPGRP